MLPLLSTYCQGKWPTWLSDEPELRRRATTYGGVGGGPTRIARPIELHFPARGAGVAGGLARAGPSDGGNQVIGPSDYASKPLPGGPSALDRLQSDVISLPGVSSVIWLEGINDFGAAGASAQAVSDGVREGVKRLRESIPGVRIYMATLTGALNSTPTHGTPEVEAKRKELNSFIRNAGIFDGVIDFDVITPDPKTGELKAEYQPNSTTGGPGDKLHPNRAGYAAMGNGVDLIMILGK